MEEDIDMEVEMEMVFEEREIDTNYEFDAPWFFDFTREESLLEAREVQRWFESATSYPPSPFVAKLDAEIADTYHNLDSIDALGGEPFSVDMESSECDRKDRGIVVDCNLHKVFCQPLKLATGLAFNNDTSTNKVKGKTKSFVKPICPRGSTLMKPTTSQLAKQSRRPQVDGSRYQTKVFQNERSLCKSSVVESQAAKRQKLEGGKLCKVADVKQQTYFVHKMPKKDGTVDSSSVHAKLKITVSREPDLKTANRAQRMRPKKNADPEQVKLAPPRFKARPFNRKIFEAPSFPFPKKSTPRLPKFQEFHLKTLERAKQHTSAVDKIFSSKGDLGVLRNSKRETTAPVGFNFHTEKKIHHHPPTELFSKLSLTSELQKHNGSQIKLTRPSSTYAKGLKENRLNPLQGEQEKINVKEKLSFFSERQAQYGSVTPITKAGNHLCMRNLGIG